MSTPFILNFPALLDDADSLGRASNDAAGLLAASGLAVGATSLDLSLLADADKFEVSGPIMIGSEIIYYGSKTGITFSSLVRGREGSTEAAHSAGVAVEQFITAKYHRIHSEAIIALEVVALDLKTKSDGSYVRITAATYTKPESVGIIDADATAAAIGIDLGVSGARQVRVRKSPDDVTFNAVTITYGALTVALDTAGQTVLFIPSGANWLLWEQSF